jgi:hypothetical protein
MHAALRKNFRDGVAHDFADAQLALRAAGGGSLLVVAGHCGLSNIFRQGRAFVPAIHGFELVAF